MAFRPPGNTFGAFCLDWHPVYQLREREAQEAYIKPFSDAEWSTMQEAVINAQGCERSNSCSSRIIRYKKILDQSALYMSERDALKDVKTQYKDAMAYLSAAQAECSQRHYYKGQVALNNAAPFVVRKTPFNNERARLCAMLAQTTFSNIADFASIYPGAGANLHMSGIYNGAIMFFGQPRKCGTRYLHYWRTNRKNRSDFHIHLKRFVQI